jgi:hypothetical protein
MTGPLDARRITLFLAAGVVNTAFGYLAFAALLGCGLPKELAVSGSTLAGLIFNFGTYRAAFEQVGMSRLPHFVLFYGAILAANIVLLRALTATGLNPYAAQGVVVLVIVPASFLGLRQLVFPELKGPTR